MSNETEFTDFEVQVDFNEVPAMAGGFTQLPIGDYVFEVKDAKQQNSKSSGQPMVTVTLEVVEIVNCTAENPESFIGNKAWNNYSLQPQSLGRLKQLMVACGTNLDKFRASEILSARFIGTVTHSKGDPQVGPNGQPTEAKTFVNVVNERPLDAAPAEPAKAPPITQTAPATKAAGKTTTTNGAARKA